MKQTENLSPTEWDILNILAEADMPLGTKQIASRTGRSVHYITTLMRKFSELDLVSRFPARGHSYVYAVKPKEELKIQIKENRSTDVTPVDLANLLTAWSQKKWEPKIFNYAINLPYGLAKLYELAVSVAYGSTIQIHELVEIKSQLQNFKVALENTLGVVNGILDRKELWDTTQLATYLLSDGSDPVIIKDKVQQLKDVNLRI